METKQLMTCSAPYHTELHLVGAGAFLPHYSTLQHIASTPSAKHAEQLRHSWNAYPELIKLLELVQEQLCTPGSDLYSLLSKIDDAVLEHHEWQERLAEL